MFCAPVFRTLLAAVLFVAAWSGAWAQFGSIADQPSDIMDGIGDWAGIPLPDGSVLRAEFPEDLPWDTQISVRGGYDTNVFTSTLDPISSLYTNGTIGLVYKFGGERLRIETDLTAGVTYYFSRPGKKQDYSLDWTVVANYDATARLSFSLDNRISYLSQPDFYISGADAQRLGDYWYTSTGIGMTYIIRPRLSSVTKYTYDSLTYVEPALNDIYGRIDQTLSQSLQYLLFPTTKAILEVQVRPTIYYVADYDTTAFSVLTGFDHQFNPRFTWNLRFGGEARESQNPIQGTQTTFNPNVSSDLSWTFSERTTASWNLTYASEPASGTFGASVRQTFRTGLNGSLGLTSRITLNGGLYYQHNLYEQSAGTDFQEDIFSGTLGVTFQISRNWTVNALYQYVSDTYKDLPGLGYERSIIYAGVNLLF
jgi:hypothetical protein